MKKTLIFIALLFNGLTFSQVINRQYIYQFELNDSLNIDTCRILSFQNNKIVKLDEFHYLLSDNFEIEPYCSIDKSETLYFYDLKNRLIKEIIKTDSNTYILHKYRYPKNKKILTSYSYDRRVIKRKMKGYGWGNEKGCVVDYEETHIKKYHLDKAYKEVFFYNENDSVRKIKKIEFKRYHIPKKNSIETFRYKNDTVFWSRTYNNKLVSFGTKYKSKDTLVELTKRLDYYGKEPSNRPDTLYDKYVTITYNNCVTVLRYFGKENSLLNTIVYHYSNNVLTKRICYDDKNKVLVTRLYKNE